MRCVRRFLAVALSAAGAAFAPGPARGAELATELDELAAAVASRISAADGTKEAKRLEKARRKLEGVDPLTAGAPEVGAALKAVFGAKSADPALVDEATDVLACLQTLVEAEKGAAEEGLDDLLGAYLSKLEKKLAGADAKLAEAASLVASDPRKAAEALLAAYSKYVKSGRYAEKALALQERFGTCGSLGGSTGIRATITGPDGFRRTFSSSSFAQVVNFDFAVGGCRKGRGTGTCASALDLNLAYSRDSRARGEVRVNLVRYVESSDFEGGAIQDLSWIAFDSFYAEVSESTAGLVKGCFRGTLTLESGLSPPNPASVDIEGTFVVSRPK